jgi:hypothetical protein
MTTAAELISLKCEEVFKHRALRNEALDLIDDVTQLMSELGESELCEKMHQIYLDLETYAHANEDMPFGVVIDLFASRTK